MQSTSIQAEATGPTAPRVWVLADDRPGHRTQAIGLAQSLGRDYDIKDLHFTPLNRVSNRLLGASLMGLDRSRSSPLEAPWPDLVIAMGRRSAPVARWIGAQGGDRTRLVQLGRKGADSAAPFDLSVTCSHFRLPPHARRLVITVPITQVTPGRLKEEAARWQGLFTGPAPHIALLVGGTTAQHRLNARVAERLAGDAVAFASEVGGTLHIVTSRRTGAKATAALRRVAGTDAHVHEWSREAEKNPYLGYLALADVLIVTGESESMLAEAAALGKTLYIYPIPEKPDALKRRIAERILGLSRGNGTLSAICGWLMERGYVRPPRRLEEMHAALYRAGSANPFGVPLKEAVHSALPDTAAIISRVHAIMEAEHAPRAASGGQAGWLARLGFVAPSDSRTFWFQGGEAEDFDGLEEILRVLAGRYPRVLPLFVTPRRDTADLLRMAHPEAMVAVAPLALAGGAQRMLRRLNPRLVFLLGDGDATEKPVIEAAGSRHVPVVRLHSGAAESAHEQGVELFLPAETDSARVLKRVVPLMQRDLKQRRSEMSGPLHPYRLGLAFLHSSLGRAIVDRRYRRIDGIEALRRALGQPKTILCLGNGPSSEDPRVRNLAHDCLFRVNDRWQGRGLLCDPDVVFTGDSRTVASVRGTIFAFQNEAAADRLKLQRFLGLKDPALRFTVVKGMGTFLDEMDLPVVPTNGATMLATAVALAPERLVIAGIDLFQDPRGGYPGDRTTVNAYTPRHDREIEIAIIQRALEVYQGEVTILSDVLAETLAEGTTGGAVVETSAPALKDAAGR